MQRDLISDVPSTTKLGADSEYTVFVADQIDHVIELMSKLDESDFVCYFFDEPKNLISFADVDFSQTKNGTPDIWSVQIEPSKELRYQGKTEETESTFSEYFSFNFHSVYEGYVAVCDDRPVGWNYDPAEAIEYRDKIRNLLSGT